MNVDEMMQQITGLKRRVTLLEGENKELRGVVGYTVKTLDLHKDPEANPLAKMCDRGIAEERLRKAAEKYPC